MSAPIAETARPLPPPRDGGAAAAIFDDWHDRAERGENEGLQRLLDLLDGNEATRNLVLAVAVASPFLRGLIERFPDYAHACLTRPADDLLGDLTVSIAAEALAAASEAELMSALRIARSKSALLVALADVTGVWTLDQTTDALTRCADAALSGAVDWLLRSAAGGGAGDPFPEAASGYVVIAMGKHGARELNYSSDIDLMVFFDPHAAAKNVSDPSTHYVRLTRRLVKILQERTGDGYVYRVDLRLRPDPRATNVAIAIEAAAQYYESMGQNWERAAMIKARPVAGDIALGNEFLERLAPFIWRKYLDFAAIADVQSLKRQIHAFKGHGEIAIAGHNIKVGRGGIREVEFFVQTQQLIAGGRAPHLRGSRTVPMLARLAEAGWISDQVAADMTSAYAFLRMVEHRLQMVDDEQTQTLPTDPDRLEDLARFAGFPSLDAFASDLLGHLRKVQAHYDALFETAPGLGDEQGNLVFTGGEDDPDTLETLARMGYARPSDVSAIVRAWHFGRSATMRSARARELLTEIMPVLLDALARTGHPDQALIAFDKFLSGLPAGVQLFSLLKANPHLLRLLADILGAAPRLADILARRTRVLDAVLDPGFFAALPSHAELDESITEQVAGGAFEEVLDAMRVFGREQRFRIGVRILSATVSGEEAGRAYSELAEGLIAHLFDVVCAEFEARHGTLPGGEAAVVAMGKLGGREMTASSDLDLMLIYDCDPAAQGSDGPRPLAPNLYFIRLTQRLINALSAQTAEGELYEVDMRLRPSGNKGPIATHIKSFVDYHASSAWTWEKLALTRARSVAGSAALRDRVDGAIVDALREPRDPAATARDVVEMRARIAEERGDADIWDLKNAQGGLVDLEFICQYLQVVNAAEVPECLDENTQGALGKLAAHGLIAPEAAHRLIEASRLLSALSQVQRLCLDAKFDPETAPEGLKTLLQRAADAADFAQLENTLRDTQARVKDLFDQLVRSAT